MSVLIGEDFGGYGTGLGSKNFMLDGPYAEVGFGTICSVDPDPNAPAGSLCLETNCDGVDGYRIRRVFSGARNTIGVSWRLWLDSIPPLTTARPCMTVLDPVGVPLISLTVDTIGRLAFHEGYGNVDPVVTTDSPVITARGWNHIDIECPTSSASGTYVIKVNGVIKLTVPSINVGAQAQQVVFANPGAFGGNLKWYVKDWIVRDTLGGVNDSSLGTVQVKGRLLSGDVTKGGWLGSTGTTLYSLLGNSPPLDSTQYVSAPFPLPSPCQFTVEPLQGDVTSVRAMILQVRAKNIDGGDGNIQTSLISSGDAVAGADNPITSAFAYREDIFETDPHTSSNWTPVSADNVVVQLDRTV